MSAKGTRGLNNSAGTRLTVKAPVSEHHRIDESGSESRNQNERDLGRKDGNRLHDRIYFRPAGGVSQSGGRVRCAIALA